MITVQYLGLLVSVSLGVLFSGIEGSTNFTQCVGSNGINVRCPSSVEMIWIESGLYGETQNENQNTFCDNPTSNPGLDCTVQRTTSLVSQCNTFTNCYVYVSTSDVTNYCIGCQGFAYVFIIYDCLPRLKSDGVTYIDFVTIGAATNVYTHLWESMYLMSTGYPQQTQQNCQCQVQAPPNTQLFFGILDLRGSWLNSTGSCPYNLYINNGVSYTDWCTGNQWSYTQWFIPSSASAVQLVDVVFRATSIQPAAQGAVWIMLQANRTDGVIATNINITCGSQVKLWSIPSTTFSSTSATTPTKTTTPLTTTTSLTTTQSTTTKSTTKTTTTTMIVPTTPTALMIQTTTAFITPTSKPTSTLVTTTTTTTPITTTVTTTSETIPTTPSPSAGQPIISQSTTVASSNISSTAGLPSSNQSNNGSSNNSTAIIIGCCIAVGILFIIILVVAVTRRRHKHQRRQQGHEPKLPDVVGSWEWESTDVPNEKKPNSKTKNPPGIQNRTSHTVAPVVPGSVRSAEHIYAEINDADLQPNHSNITSRLPARSKVQFITNPTEPSRPGTTNVGQNNGASTLRPYTIPGPVNNTINPENVQLNPVYGSPDIYMY